MQTYVDQANQLADLRSDVNSFTKMVDKIGKQITLQTFYYDRLTSLDAEDLPLGKSIEEFMISLTESKSYDDADPESDLAPALPDVEKASYSYSLGKRFVRTTVPYNVYERSMISTEGAANFGADIMNKLENSYQITKYATKKQLLGNAGKKAIEAGLTSTLPVVVKEEGGTTIVDATAGEKFVMQIKQDVEAAQFPNQKNIAGALVGGTPELVLYVRSGTLPSLEVSTLSGAFHREDLAIPAKIEVVDDFGDNEDVVAILADSRAIKLYNGYNAVRSKENAVKDWITFVRHFEWTGFISKFAFIKAYKQA